jgi:serine/threonine-protein kinase
MNECATRSACDEPNGGEGAGAGHSGAVGEGAGAGLEVGARVGRYRIVARIGDGGMGIVYRAAHTLLRRPVAIKVLRPELGSCAGAEARFRAEACAAAAVHHPGVVEVYDFGHTEAGRAFIAMELLEGQTLAARIAQRGRLGAVEAMVLARRIAGPLAAAHDRGVVHRDLKPENVFVVRRGRASRRRRGARDSAGERVKLLDFGVAKLGTADLSSGAIVGTPAYMAPEQCRGDCDARADLYALGCVLFEMLTGAPPYGRGRSTAELVAAHLRAPVPAIGPDPAVPPVLRRLIASLLAKSPADRPRDARAVIVELDRALASRGVTAPDDRADLGLAGKLVGGLAASLAASLADLAGRMLGPAWGPRLSAASSLALAAPVDTAAQTVGAGWARGSAADPGGTPATRPGTQPGMTLGPVGAARGAARGVAMNNAPTEPLDGPFTAAA